MTYDPLTEAGAVEEAIAEELQMALAEAQETLALAQAAEQDIWDAMRAASNYRALMKLSGSLANARLTTISAYGLVELLKRKVNHA